MPFIDNQDELAPEVAREPAGEEVDPITARVAALKQENAVAGKQLPDEVYSIIEQKMRSKMRKIKLIRGLTSLAEGVGKVADVPRSLAMNLPYRAITGGGAEYGLTGAEALKRGGMEEGERISETIPIFSETGKEMYLPNKYGPLDITSREAAGFALDTLGDLAGGAILGKGLKLGSKAALKGISYLPKLLGVEESLVKAAGKASKIASSDTVAGKVARGAGAVGEKAVGLAKFLKNPVSKTTGAAAEKIYAKPFKKYGIDLTSVKGGKERYSGTAMKQWFAGGPEKLVTHVEKIKDKSDGIVGGVLEELAKKAPGEEALVSDIIGPHIATLEKMALEKPSMREAATHAAEKLKQYYTAYPEKVTPMQIQEMKKDLGKLVKSWDSSVIKPIGEVDDELRAATATARNKIEALAEGKVSPKAAASLKKANKEWGEAMTVQTKVRDVSEKASENLFGLTGRETMLGAGGMGLTATGNTALGNVAMGMAAIDRVRRAMSTMTGATHTGLGLKVMSKTGAPMLDAALRQKLIKKAVHDKRYPKEKKDGEK